MANLSEENERLMVELESLRSQINFLRSERFERLFVETETLNINSQEVLEIILRESEERFLCIADNTPALIWMAGLDKGCFYFNQPWLNLTGRTFEEEQGNGWTAGIHPDDFDYCWQTYSRAFDRRQPFTVEYRLRDATGEYHYLLENGVPRFAQDGRFLGYIGSCIDITDRRKVCQEIEKSEEKYRVLVESINAIIIRWLPTGEITFVNQYCKDFFGFREEEMIGKSVFESIVPKVSSSGMDLESYISDITQNPEKYQSTENENICKNGDHVWVAWTNKPIFDSQGNLIELLSLGIDITSRKLAEDQLRQRELELLETQRLAKLGRWKFDLASGTIYWSEEIYRMFGRDAQQGPPSYQEHTQSIDAGDRQRHQEIVDKVLETGGTQDLTYRFYRQDGSLGWLWTKIEAVHNPVGEVTGLQGIAMDISSQKKVEVELERLNEELEERVLERTEEFIQSETRLQEVNEQLENRLQELKNRNDQMESLSILSEYLQSCVIVEDACSCVAALALPLFPNSTGAIFIFDSTTNYFELVKSWGTATCSKSTFKGPDCWALRRGQAHWVGVHQHDLFCGHLENTCVVQESLCIPLIAQGETLGLFNLCSDQAGSIHPEQQQLARAVAEQVSLAIANIRLRERLHNESIRDPLTGLFNRRYLEQFWVQEISRARRYDQTIGVIMADIDHFKQFNDRLGHNAGDYVLKIIGRTLQSNIRGSDMACRYGGEEMLIVLPKTAIKATFTKAEQIRTAIGNIQEEFKGEILGHLTISLGVAGYPTHGETMETIIKAADEALYRAKAAGRDRVMMAN